MDKILGDKVITTTERNLVDFISEKRQEIAMHQQMKAGSEQRIEEILTQLESLIKPLPVNEKVVI